MERDSANAAPFRLPVLPYSVVMSLHLLCNKAGRQGRGNKENRSWANRASCIEFGSIEDEAGKVLLLADGGRQVKGR